MLIPLLMPIYNICWCPLVYLCVVPLFLRVLFYFVVMFWAWNYLTFSCFGLCFKFRPWYDPLIHTINISHSSTSINIFHLDLSFCLDLFIWTKFYPLLLGIIWSSFAWKLFLKLKRIQAFLLLTPSQK